MLVVGAGAVAAVVLVLALVLVAVSVWSGWLFIVDALEARQ